ncbi:MAG: DNA primase [Algoriphagus sp.]|jgi:DNA primase|uniref:DNA primase n=1 Tax=Algoriphagus sp. TaxID=1872435 RepID=UPI000C5D0389|nr:DNA primase [Algoriphagus sp.]MAL13395.1 DNA primase [Algoriphagus sp.]HAS60328.1 DNA primase [Algoriphagus sp.]HCB45954.1 DNA primase [Algoriphagus sp.]|tara:strand:+ start:6520 stop:8460 length:1941 start_codon:yes stop_codon:yes gene_type:complete
MGISKLTTDKVKERMDIEEIISDYVPLKKKGQNLWACCPFHGEKTPSFSVSPAKQIYKCFGCGKAGDPLQFVMDIEGIGFQEAIKHLAGKYGIEVEEDETRTPEQEQAQSERESLLIALGFARDFFVKNLQTEEGKSIGLSYFKERGFGPAIIEKFDLGYALNGWDHLLNAAKKAGFTEDILLKAGLILQKEGDPDRKYDRFRNRVTFTIHNISGKPIGFGARILTKDKNQPKYINSPETAVYHKSDVLYGMYQAKKAIRDQDNCYLVEGYTDVISLHLSGIENVVASSGTSLTDGQIKLIKRFTNQVTVLYDGDSAGIKASLRGIDLLLEGGLNVKAVVFPEGEDPDSYSRKVGSKAFQEYLNSQSQDFIGFKIGLYQDEIKRDPIRKVEVIREVVQSIGKIPDPIVRSVYAKEASGLLDIEEEIVHAELNKGLLKSQKDAYSKQKEQEESADTPFENFLPTQEQTSFSELLRLQEREMIRLLLNYGLEKLEGQDLQLSDYLLSETQELDFETPVYSRILKIYRERLARNEISGVDYFLSLDDAEVKQEVIDLISPRHEVSVHWEERHQIIINKEQDDLTLTGFKTILRLKRKFVKKMMEEAKQKIKNAETQQLDEKEIIELQEIYFALKKVQVEIDRELGIVIG